MLTFHSKCGRWQLPNRKVKSFVSYVGQTSIKNSVSCWAIVPDSSQGSPDDQQFPRVGIHSQSLTPRIKDPKVNTTNPIPKDESGGQPTQDWRLRHKRYNLSSVTSRSRRTTRKSNANLRIQTHPRPQGKVPQGTPNPSFPTHCNVSMMHNRNTMTGSPCNNVKNFLFANADGSR
jgi:hypothetical protein